ncbi:MAG: hypothetical protein JWP28_3560 [Phenylobacterium sp.]|uniref:DUF2155 domain-containing protein n=1 Tax=Phenylobacterium sp. TaxID=1871053 RepID=UPI00260782BE|nr:DUF2155 domain-containing protein [Phenylobacterium sp.]MDB5462525.1 hypothetical protein [Phenylobacterium sp.]MDB5499529.1 hypothetical protein [Phenylobacterium sp.]
MPLRLTPRYLLQRATWFAALVAVAGAGLATAQPAPPPPTPMAPETPSRGAPAEEAPPVSVATPAPIAVPPISEKEVAAAPPPASTEAKPPGVPERRARYDVAVLEALDKVTAESLRFEAAVGRPIRYKSLIFTVKACERSAPDEPIDDSIAYLTVDSQPRPAPGKPPLSPRQTFKGWMYASSPGLHPLEHPVYDAWLITCRAAAPPIASTR